MLLVLPCRWFPPWAYTPSWIHPGTLWTCWPTPSRVTRSSLSAPYASSSPGCAQTMRTDPCNGCFYHHPSGGEEKTKGKDAENVNGCAGCVTATKEKKSFRLTARAVEYELKMLILNSFSAFLKTTSTMVSFLPSSESRSAIWGSKAHQNNLYGSICESDFWVNCSFNSVWCLIYTDNHIRHAAWEFKHYVPWGNP